MFINAETSVEDACDVSSSSNRPLKLCLNSEQRLSSEDVPCLVISGENSGYAGLFDVRLRVSRSVVVIQPAAFQYADVNAFLTLAATRHTFSLDDAEGDPRRNNIIEAAKAGCVPVHLVSSEYPVSTAFQRLEVIFIFIFRFIRQESHDMP